MPATAMQPGELWADSRGLEWLVKADGLWRPHKRKPIPEDLTGWTLALEAEPATASTPSDTADC